MIHIALIFILLLFAAPKASASAQDSVKHWGYGIGVSPSSIIVMDKYQRGSQKDKNNFSIEAELTRQWSPKDSSLVARDYNYPSLSITAKQSFNHGVTMHREANKLWRRREIVDYDSRLGNSFSVFGTFRRPLMRNRVFEFDYTLSTGAAYSKTIYDPYNNVDNELTGSHLMIYFGFGTHITFHPSQDWGIRLGADYWHISNGALSRPNKGANFVGPSVALVYTPYYKELTKHKALKRENTTAEKRESFRPYIFMNIAAGIGAKSLQEDWNNTCYGSRPGTEAYVRSKFPVYATFAGQIDLMLRYQRRWASGIGFDAFYGHYAFRLKDLNSPKKGVEYHPWSTGIALKHEVYFGSLMCQIGLGYYLHREMGTYATKVEKPYYERVGISYGFRQLGGLRLGFNVKAHSTKADYMELLLTMPIKLIQF